ncbi:MAG: Hpt domain-containing protein [Halorhodospira halophila]|uniref:Hpt domain-containing protein n=1 Tax=Halorhodospira TaxID=85108 RepID=UPI001EE959A4|nr:MULTISPECIES: Hpt domain-containing protein [Halorhodospira]MCC3751078.1 Hpt domain-containing protein [Halorhodospira halophila]MCG5541352.1 Hpt domain-containing protein [Halorhodospira sp. M39old]MCG5546807.1 Hpt domain-containing protein [Halorhodospira sp. M38]
MEVIDINSALERLDGDRELCRELLLDFRSDYSGVDRTLREKLRDGTTDDARELLHNLRGAAGNLGMGRLEAAAETLSRQIRAGAVEASALDTFSEELNLVLSELERFEQP